MKNYCLALYGLYALGIFMQFAPVLALPGLALLIIAYVMNLMGKKRAAGTVYESHMQWLSRTFYIGTCVFLPVAAIAAEVVLLLNTDISAYVAAVNTGDPAAMAAGMDAYLVANKGTALLIFGVFLTPPMLWLLHRWWVGGRLAQAEKPVENVTRWF